MKTEYIEVSATQKELQVEVPTDIVESAIEKTTRDYGKSARIPGFRPGRAPSTIVRKRFKEQILHDVMHELIPRVVDEALRERDVEPIDTPAIRDVELAEGTPLKFKAAFETVPPIAAVDYDTITLRRSPIAIADEAVDSTLGRLQERNARFVPVEGRAAEAGDILTADLTRQVTSQPKAAEAPASEPESHTGVTIELGSAVNPPGFDEAMIGVPVGETKSFTVTFPDDYPVEDLQGAQVDYTVTLHGIKRKELPALDDEFAKDMGDFETLDALRERVRADLQRDAERSQEREIRDDLLKQLAARAGEDVPPSLVDKEIDRRLEQFVGQLVDQRIDPMKAGINWDEFRDRQREPALEAVKSLLVLDDTARRESIVVTEEEMEQEIARLADRTGRSVDTVRARLGQEGGLSRLRAALRREKAVEFLLSRVTLLNV